MVIWFIFKYRHWIIFCSCYGYMINIQIQTLDYILLVLWLYDLYSNTDIGLYFGRVMVIWFIFKYRHWIIFWSCYGYMIYIQIQTLDYILVVLWLYDLYSNTDIGLYFGRVMVIWFIFKYRHWIIFCSCYGYMINIQIQTLDYILLVLWLYDLYSNTDIGLYFGRVMVIWLIFKYRHWIIFCSCYGYMINIQIQTLDYILLVLWLYDLYSNTDIGLYFARVMVIWLIFKYRHWIIFCSCYGYMIYIQIQTLDYILVALWLYDLYSNTDIGLYFGRVMVIWFIFKYRHWIIFWSCYGYMIYIQIQTLDYILVVLWLYDLYSNTDIGLYFARVMVIWFIHRIHIRRSSIDVSRFCWAISFEMDLSKTYFYNEQFCRQISDNLAFISVWTFYC